MRFFLLSVCAATFLTVPFIGAAQESEAPSNASSALPAITVTKVVEKQLSDRIIVSGLISPVEMVQVAPLIEGQPIEKLIADVGDTVQAGQVLAQLSRSTLELQKSQFLASLASARATIAQAEAQMIDVRASAEEAERIRQRTSKLLKQGVASDAAADTTNANAVSATARLTAATQSLEAARAHLALVQAQLRNVDLQLSRTDVKAPVGGAITARNAVLGAIASAAGQPMFSIIRDNALEMRADVAEIDLPRLGLGQKARISVIGFKQPLEGKVRLIEPTIDPVSRLGRVRIVLDDAQDVFSGMFVEAEIIADQHTSLAVPITAINSGAEGTYVMKVQGGIVEKHLIETGIRDAGWIEVVSGLGLGDTLVLKAGAFVRDGDRISPVFAAPE